MNEEIIDLATNAWIKLQEVKEQLQDSFETSSHVVCDSDQLMGVRNQLLAEYNKAVNVIKLHCQEVGIHYREFDIL